MHAHIMLEILRSEVHSFSSISGIRTMHDVRILTWLACWRVVRPVVWLQKVAGRLWLPFSPYLGASSSCLHAGCVNGVWTMWYAISCGRRAIKIREIIQRISQKF
jgi:hypothetical protein